ncbi:MAG: hypothetical protein ACK5HR_06055, partial [Mycoplasmatales bacterium]
MYKKSKKFIEGYKNVESQLWKNIKDKDMQSFATLLRPLILEMGFNEFGMGIGKEEIMIELPAKSDFNQLIINNYFSKIVKEANISLVVLPNLRRKQQEVFTIEEKEVNVKDTIYFYEQTEGMIGYDVE